jgi:hypothetical protein
MSQPAEQYSTDPVAYVLNRLKEPVIMPHQAEILRALSRGVAGTDLPRIAVRCGHKTGMTRMAIWAALWCYECFPVSTTYLCAPSERHARGIAFGIDRVIVAARSRGADVKLTPLVDDDDFVYTDGDSAINVVTHADVGLLAGLSGRALFIVESASALSLKSADAFNGNMMGGGAVLWISNPQRSAGPFFDCFGRLKEYWQTLHVNGEAVAMCDEAGALPHVVSPEMIAEWDERLGGRDSPNYRVRVCGEFTR